MFETGALIFRDGHRERNQAEPASNRFIDASQSRPVITRDDQLELRGVLEEILAHESRRYPVAAGERFDLALGPTAAFLGFDCGHETSAAHLTDRAALNYTLRQPLGVVGLIAPWNLPLYLLSWKIAPAIAAGNTCVAKPSEMTPMTANRLAELVLEAGIPAGVVNLVHGRGEEAGAALVRHSDVKLVSFTGSAAVGREIASACGENLKRVSLELGGKNAQIVMEDADLNLALEGALWGAFGTTGQRCTATSRLILHRDIKPKLTDMLVARAEKIKIGDGLDESVEIGPLINHSAREKVHRYVQIGKQEGARLLTGAEIYEAGKWIDGYFYRPTIFDQVTPSMRIAQEEIFGPVLSIIEVKSFEEAIEVLNGTAYGLSGSIYTNDVARAFRAMRDIEAGITYVNGPTIGAEVHLPFGGGRDTGNGHREAGTTVYDIFSEWKSIYVDYSGKLQKAQIDNAE